MGASSAKSNLARARRLSFALALLGGLAGPAAGAADPEAWHPLEALVVQVDEQIITTSEFALYRRLVPLLETPWRAAPPDADADLAELLVDRLVLAWEADLMGLDQLSPAQLDREVKRLFDRLDPPLREDLRRLIAAERIDQAELEELVRRELLIQRVIAKKFPYMQRLAADSGDPTPLRHSIATWLESARRRALVRIDLGALSPAEAPAPAD